jgi:hypothetical protein
MATAASVGIGDTLETKPWIRFMHFPECARVLRPHGANKPAVLICRFLATSLVEVIRTSVIANVRVTEHSPSLG